MKPINRRNFLKGAAAASSLSTAACTADKGGTPELSPNSTIPENAWQKAEAIYQNTTVPSFPDRDFNVVDFGAVGDGQTDCSKAIHAAINECSSQGGGRVLVPAGRFLSGPIHLESSVNLHLDEAAVVLFHTDPSHYLPEVFTRWEGIEHMGYSPLIYAFGKTNIAITGKGTLDGQANVTTWWPWKGNKEWGVEGYPSQKAARDKLLADAEQGVPPEQRHYSEGAYLRPPFVQPYRCDNILIEDIRIINAPFWLLHPTLCKNVTVRGVHFESLGPNSDGCDPESCENVVIENCFFDTGDDCIAIKSGRNADGRRLATPTQNVVIRNCKMREGHGGIVIGSEISGGVNNVYAENNEMSSPKLDRGIRIKTNASRGGLIEHLYYRNNTIGEVVDAIVVNFYYEEGDQGNFDPTVRNVYIDNLHCAKAKRVFHIRGFPRAPIKNFSLSDCTFAFADSVGVIENVEDFHVNNVSINGETLEFEPS